MKYGKYRAVWALLLISALLCGTTAAAAETAAWGSVQGETAVLCLPGTEEAQFTCQVGSAEAEVKSVTPLRELETPVETIVLLDNSLSIQKSERPVIKELLGDLIANRMEGERYTFATISDQVNYLCNGVSDYASLKTLVEGLEFKDQRTQLADGLYAVLDSLKQSDEGTLRRVLLIADGVDNKQVGYTQSELAALIQELGYPLYTVGCTNQSASATEELQNLFALSRLTPGASYYLPEVQQTMDIVSGVTAWNSAVQLVIQLPAEVCDGMPKALRAVGGDGSVYTAELKMPLAAPAEQETPPTPAPAPAPAPEVPAPQPVEEPAPKGDSLPLILIGGVAVLAVAIIAALLLLRKKKDDERIVEEPEAIPPVEAPAETEIVPGDSGDPGKTEGIFDAAPSTRLVFQDLDTPSRRIETALKDTILVGRDGSVCQVVFSEASVARQQCRIYRQGSWIMVENLSKSNITKLDGRPVTEPRELVSGSTLKMGRVQVRVTVQ
ncbi:MAG: VWA domain-containing protein [Oscillibacter sp.]|nr:VWA domain-containing protein [Oscillibacter sp.]